MRRFAILSAHGTRPGTRFNRGLYPKCVKM